MTRHHISTIRVYYEDTDAGGVVYHTGYLRFAERARTEMLRIHGIEQRKLWHDEHLGFVVRHVTMDITSSAALDDLLEIHSYVSKMTGASFTMAQHIVKDQQAIAIIHVQIACINTRSFKAKRLPKTVVDILNHYVS